MYKTKLQEICQRKRWSLPNYTVEKTGFDHIPHFQATVTVNGLTFTSGDRCNSSKEAQNEAAGRAFNHFSVPELTPSEAPIAHNPPSLPGTPSMTSDLNKEFLTPGTWQLKSHEMNQIPQAISARLVKDNVRCKDTDKEAEANMYKSKLNEFCQQSRWRPPVYEVKKMGPDHLPRFQATVTVNGFPFETHDQCKSSKDAQNIAARLAFDHFCTPNLPSSLSVIPSHSSLCGNGFTVTAKMKITEGSVSVIAGLKEGIPLTEPQKTNQVPQLIGTARCVKDDDRFIDMQHSYKNQLQNYAQKSNISLPAYSCENEGPPHASRFKGVVRVGEKTHESQELFPTMKEAEHVAAKTALMSLSQNGVQEDESGYKNLLQELAQKECFGLPSYDTLKYGEAHVPIFVSKVEVEGEIFEGRQAKTKKQAEMSAARIAYMTLKERMRSRSPSAHQEKGNPKFSSSGSHSQQTTDLQQNFEAEQPLIPNEEHEEENEVSIGVDPYSLQSQESGSVSSAHDELSLPSSSYYDSDGDTEPLTESPISSYLDTSSCNRAIVFPLAHPRSVPPGGTKKILNNEFIAYTYKPESRHVVSSLQ